MFRISGLVRCLLRALLRLTMFRLLACQGLLGVVALLLRGALVLPSRLRFFLRLLRGLFCLLRGLLRRGGGFRVFRACPD